MAQDLFRTERGDRLSWTAIYYMAFKATLDSHICYQFETPMLNILAHIFMWNHYSSLFLHKRFYQSIKICIKFSVRRWQQSKRGQTWEWSKFLSHSLFQLRISFFYHKQSICFQLLPTYGHSLDSTFYLPIANINVYI